MSAATLAVLAAAAYPVRQQLSTSVASTAAGLTVAPMVGAVASRGLLVLIAAAGVLAVLSWVRDRASFWRLGAAGVGTVLSYVLSEALKSFVTQERPCRDVVETILECPGVGDWSWPSNHSVLAGALVAACVLVAPRSAWLVVPAALLVAGARVAAGVHYVHDVTSGLALGSVVVVAVVWVSRPVLDRLSE